MPDSCVLELKGFGVAFGERVVLREVNLCLPAMGPAVLLGPSGTGKSTLLRTLAGFNHGNPALRIWGQARYGDSPCSVSNHPALVMQHSRLLVSNVLENLVCEMPDRASLTRSMQVEMLAERLLHYHFPHLRDCLLKKVIELPAADQRAIAILRVALSDPALLLVDEPTTGLQPAQATAVLQLLEQIASERALLVVLHHLQQARDLGGQVALLANGVIEECAGSQEFFDSPRSECAKAFVLTGSCPEGARPEIGPGVVAAAPPPVSVANTVTQEPAAAAVVSRSAAWGPRGFLWLLPGQLAGTPWPGVVHPVRYDLEALRSVGVTYLISLTEDPFDPALAGEFGMACLASPMPDMAPPTLAQGVFLCQAIDIALAGGQVVAVHCHAGLGRTGTVLAAYWLWRHGGRVSAPEALEDVRRIEPGWVQSEIQVRFLEDFSQVVATAGKRIAATPASGPTTLSAIAASIFSDHLHLQKEISNESL